VCWDRIDDGDRTCLGLSGCLVDGIRLREWWTENLGFREFPCGFRCRGFRGRALRRLWLLRKLRAGFRRCRIVGKVGIGRIDTGSVPTREFGGEILIRWQGRRSGMVRDKL
jgi:hypothetical protein